MPTTYTGHSEINALKRFISTQPKVTQDQQTSLLVELMQAETAWREEMRSAHGLAPYEHLVGLHMKNSVGILFRVRQADSVTFFADVRTKRWDKIAEVGINYRFVVWSRPCARPTPTMLSLERKIAELRQRLANSLLALILRDSIAFAHSSKTCTFTVADLVGLGAEGVLNGTDKYVPEGEVSARSWKSVCIGRMSGNRIYNVTKQTTAYLEKDDQRRLYQLRAGSIPASEVTDDDRQLLTINAPIAISHTSPDQKHLGEDFAEVDLPDPGMNPEELLIWREEEAEREATLASLATPKPPKAPRGQGRRGRKPIKVHDRDTGEVYPSVREAMRLTGVKAATFYRDLAKARRFVRIPNERQSS